MTIHRYALVALIPMALTFGCSAAPADEAQESERIAAHAEKLTAEDYAFHDCYNQCAGTLSVCTRGYCKQDPSNCAVNYCDMQQAGTCYGDARCMDSYGACQVACQQAHPVGCANLCYTIGQNNNYGWSYADCQSWCAD